MFTSFQKTNTILTFEQKNECINELKSLYKTEPLHNSS